MGIPSSESNGVFLPPKNFNRGHRHLTWIRLLLRELGNFRALRLQYRTTPLRVSFAVHDGLAIHVGGNWNSEQIEHCRRNIHDARFSNVDRPAAEKHARD